MSPHSTVPRPTAWEARGMGPLRLRQTFKNCVGLCQCQSRSPWRDLGSGPRTVTHQQSCPPEKWASTANKDPGGSLSTKGQNHSPAAETGPGRLRRWGRRSAG